MLHQLRYHHKTTALWVLAALLMCVLAGCLQHQLKPPAASAPMMHHAHHGMTHEHHSQPAQTEPASCHSKSNCSLEQSQTSSFNWEPLQLPFVLIALLPILVGGLRRLTPGSFGHNPREGPPQSGYPPPYLTLQVLRN